MAVGSVEPYICWTPGPTSGTMPNLPHHVQAKPPPKAIMTCRLRPPLKSSHQPRGKKRAFKFPIHEAYRKDVLGLRPFDPHRLKYRKLTRG